MKSKTPVCVNQQALMVIAAIDADRRHELEKLLGTISQDIENNAVLPFSKLEHVHFCRFMILPGYNKGPDQLAYSTNFDGTLTDHLEDITRPASIEGFHSIFSCCKGYTTDRSPTRAVQDFIKRHKKRVHTFYRGHRGYSLSMIRKQQSIYLEIQDYLNRTDTLSMKPTEIRDKVVEHVTKKIPEWKAPKIKHTFLPSIWVIILFILLPFVAMLACAYLVHLWFLVSVVILVAFTIIYYRRLEKTASEIPESEIDNYGPAEDLASIEDQQIQNQLTHLVEVRPNLLRRIVQLLILYVLDKLVIFTHNKGVLGGIASIHFARWVLIDKGRRLLFLSNYDGNWESYIGDFIDRNADGLTLAWCNTQEFPKTRWLIHDGATNEEIFKAWIRKNQVKTQVWYTAYKDLTVKNILRHHKIVTGMEDITTDEEINLWLKLL